MTSGLKVTVHVPLPLSRMSIGAFLGPCTDTLIPPVDSNSIVLQILWEVNFFIKFQIPVEELILMICGLNMEILGYENSESWD